MSGRHRLDEPRDLTSPMIHLHPFYGWISETADGKREAWGPHACDDEDDD